MSTGTGSMTAVTTTVTLVTYVTLAEAETFFNNRLIDSAWDDATNDNRSKALNMSASALNRLNYAGKRNSLTQVHPFPRDDDSVIPQIMQDACCLVAAKFLDDFTIDQLRDEARFKIQGYSTVKTTYKDGDLPHYMSGIPSAEAWDMIQPFLRQVDTIQLNRSS